MNLVEALKFIAPKLEGNMKVTHNDYGSYNVKCYGVDKSGYYVVLTAKVDGTYTETDFDVFKLKVSIDDVEEELSSEEILDIYCNGSVDPSGVEELELGDSMIFELF